MLPRMSCDGTRTEVTCCPVRDAARFLLVFPTLSLGSAPRLSFRDVSPDHVLLRGEALTHAVGWH